MRDKIRKKNPENHIVGFLNYLFSNYIYILYIILPQLVGAGLEPGIPAREAGALTSNAKGYSL